jgi:hypothetical protein
MLRVYVCFISMFGHQLPVILRSRQMREEGAMIEIWRGELFFRVSFFRICRVIVRYRLEVSEANKGRTNYGYRSGRLFSGSPD